MLFGGRRRSCEGGGRGTRRRRKWMARRRIAAPGLRRPSRSPELAETVTTALAAAQLVRGCICRLPRCRLGIAVSHPSTLYWASNHRPNYEMIIGCTYWATFRPNIFWGDLFFFVASPFVYCLFRTYAEQCCIVCFMGFSYCQMNPCAA